MNEPSQTVPFNESVDVVVPVFGESSAALDATLDACLLQDRPPRRYSLLTTAHRFLW
jgi:hypothetical protein